MPLFVEHIARYGKPFSDELIEIFVKVDDSPGLFYKLVNIFDRAGLEIIDASIFTSKDNQFAANTFITKFSRQDRVLNKSELIELSSKIEKNFHAVDQITERRKVKKKKQFLTKLRKAEIAFS